VANRTGAVVDCGRAKYSCSLPALAELIVAVVRRPLVGSSASSGRERCPATRCDPVNGIVGLRVRSHS
jgi:hypothetical protein